MRRETHMREGERKENPQCAGKEIQRMKEEQSAAERKKRI